MLPGQQQQQQQQPPPPASALSTLDVVRCGQIRIEDDEVHRNPTLLRLGASTRLFAEDCMAHRLVTVPIDTGAFRAVQTRNSPSTALHFKHPPDPLPDHRPVARSCDASARGRSDGGDRAVISRWQPRQQYCLPFIGYPQGRPSSLVDSSASRPT